MTQSCAPFACAAGRARPAARAAADCAPGIPCNNGSCGKKPLGAACGDGSECQSTHCIDGVCCDTGDCSGACRSCNVVGAAGSCRDLPTNAEPRAAGCPAEPAASCGRTGKCDGTGGCQLYPPATPCGPRSCTAAVETLVPTCNGSGVCVPAGTQSCGNYQCGGDACATSCSDDNGCAAGLSCVGGAVHPQARPGRGLHPGRRVPVRVLRGRVLLSERLHRDLPALRRHRHL